MKRGTSVVSRKYVSAKSGDFADDGIGSSSPDERLVRRVVVLNESVDLLNQILDAAEAAAANRALRFLPANGRTRRWLDSQELDFGLKSSVICTHCRGRAATSGQQRCQRRKSQSVPGRLGGSVRELRIEWLF